MYPKNFFIIAAGLSIITLISCTGARSIQIADNTAAPAVMYNQSSASNKKTLFIGPPEDIAGSALAAKATTIKETAKAGVSNKIIERGGKYAYIPPSYTMLKPEKGTEKYATQTLKQKIRKIKKFAAENNYDTTIAFFIDMQVKSSKPRFLVVNLADSSVIKKGMVAHGKGNEKFTFDRKFSNGEGSNCSSLGIYNIGKAYDGAFGLSYKLYGLNKTNNNSLKRYVVLHSMGSIPYAETKYPITQTEGCPAVAPAFLEELAPILDNAKKHVLLYIYYGDNG